MNIIILGLLIFAAICFKRLSLGLYLILFLLPTYLIRFKIGFIPFTFLEGMILVLAIIWLIKKIKNKKLLNTLHVTRYTLQDFKWPVILFFIAATISVFTSSNRLSALGDWRAFFVEPLIFFIIFLDLVRNKKEVNPVKNSSGALNPAGIILKSNPKAKQQDIISNGVKNIFYALGGCAIYISLFTIYQIFTGYLVPLNYLKEGRMTSVYGYPGAVGLYLAPILAMFIGLIIEKLKTQSSKLKAITQNLKLKKDAGSQIYWGKFFWIFAIITIILSALALLATKTEGAYLGVLAATLIILMFTPWRKWVILGTLLLGIILMIIPPSQNYLVQKATFSDVSGDVRLVLWQGTWRAIQINPVFGGGLSGFPKLYAKYKEDRHIELLKYPHNIIFNFWTETGLLGLFAFLWLIFEFFKRIIQTYKLQTTNYKLTVAAAMLALLIYGFLDVPYFKNDLSVLFWVFIALALV